MTRQVLGEHGTVKRYRQGCRLKCCTEAIRIQAAIDRESRRNRLEDAPHGTATGYFNWSCRCELCKPAGSEKNRRQRALGIVRKGGYQQRKSA